MPQGLVDRIAKLIPKVKPGKSSPLKLRDAINAEPRMRSSSRKRKRFASSVSASPSSSKASTATPRPTRPAS
jgi:hypothetical protein